MSETFKINKFALTRGDDDEIVDCSNPALLDAIKKQVTPDDDCYYIDNLNNQYWRFYTYGVYKGCVFADRFDADKYSDKERSMLVCCSEPLEFDFEGENNGGETVTLKSEDKSTYKASGWPYESVNPEYPLQTPEEAKKVNTILTNKTSPDMKSRLLDIETAEKTLKWDSTHKYTKSDILASCYRYFVIHRLREGEKYEEGSLGQFVTVVDKDWIAKDICDKYNKHAKFTGYRLVYETVYAERD